MVAAVLLAHGFETAEALVPVDILRRAGISVLVAGIGSFDISSVHGVMVRADVSAEKFDPEGLDMLVLPGGSIGVDYMRESEAVKNLILEMARLEKIIGAICAAPVLLAELGLLKGRHAVCFPSMTEELVKYGAKLKAGESVVHDRNIVTAQAVGSSFDFGLELVSVLLGWQASEKVRKNMYYMDK